MGRGIAPLVTAVTTVWLAVYVVAQVLADPPLSPGLTILAGVVLTNLSILGYPNLLRRPGARRRWRPGQTSEETTASDTIEVIGSRLPYLREGLTSEAAQRTVELLGPLLGGDAVGITDTERMLAFEGPGADHHVAGSALWIPDRAKVLRTGRTITVSGPEAIGCPHAGCPLASAALAPLVVRDQVVGTVTVYRQVPSPPRRNLVEGMAGILSLHLELAELQAQSRLNADARLEALRAQINPHFLFNTLNTIASKARTDPEEARQLLLRLADFFRYAIKQHGHFAEFAQEYFFVRTYTTLEQARFGERLHLNYDVDPQVLSVEVPVLVIQPLVENAIKHGLSSKVGRGTVTLRARVDLLGRQVDILVRDDGVGMEPQELAAVLNGDRRTDASGVGLSNISERLALLFGDRYAMDVQSRQGEGTSVRLALPIR